MTVSEYGYDIPSQGDLAKGTSGWMAQYVYNTLRLDQHSHNGIDSAQLNASSLASFTVTVLAANWVSDSQGGYTQTITAPAGVTDFNNYVLKFIFTAPSGMVGADGKLGYTRVTATTLLLHCNDNTAAFTCLIR